MSEQTTPYTVNLSNGAAMVLRHHLNQPGWTNKVSEFVTACELIGRVVPEPPAQPERPHPITAKNYSAELEQWKRDDAAWNAGAVHEIKLTEKQRDAVKLCLKQAVEKQTGVPSKPAFELFTAFGLIE